MGLETLRIKSNTIQQTMQPVLNPLRMRLFGAWASI